ncbi:hypothetical protein [Desulfofustis glycolicus]|uniref:Uncharacterized protein n=1 Tax=Desulfofustis glycolicus DSM 9705 TaxID=1121409 RepID=A0A1M5SEU6_9BACT|nr:hypothetical protein [Desulfofustis glycolicus]MCB2216117.1 hypothetical protein [Desulfobulbaceae bacterium]SHH37117.1 hypothetical protein SAMN02745124_00317 [Desulfofustis glycolicus DSM 9705]
MTRIRSFNHQAAVSFASGEALLDPNVIKLEGPPRVSPELYDVAFCAANKPLFSIPPAGRLPR